MQNLNFRFISIFYIGCGIFIVQNTLFPWKNPRGIKLNSHNVCMCVMKISARDYLKVELCLQTYDINL